MSYKICEICGNTSKRKREISNLLKLWVYCGAGECTSCRSRTIPEIAPTFATGGIDSALNGPSTVCQSFRTPLTAPEASRRPTSRSDQRSAAPASTCAKPPSIACSALRATLWKWHHTLLELSVARPSQHATDDHFWSRWSPLIVSNS